jgi:uncharacterized membrane protein
MRRIVNVTKLKAESCNKQPYGKIECGTQELWHCEVRGPFGRVYSLNAKLVYLESEKCVSWATFELDSHSDIASTGTVNFLKPSSPRGEQTLIEVTMSYSPSGLLGDIITDITAYGDTVVEDCLRDFKRHVEAEYQMKKDRALEEIAKTTI